MVSRDPSAIVLGDTISDANGYLPEFLDGNVSSLRSLAVLSPEVPLARILRLIQWSWELESLVLCSPDRVEPHYLALPRVTPLPSLRRIEFRRYVEWTSSRFTQTISLSWFASLMPNLEELVIGHPRWTLQPPRSGPQKVVFPQLRNLDISSGVFRRPRGRPSCFVLPNLRNLSLLGSKEESYVTYLFPPNLAPNTQHLTHLILRKSDVDEPTLVSHLADMPSLVHLDVRQTDAFLALVRALVHPAPDDVGPRLCPRLEHLHLESPVSLRPFSSREGNRASYPDIDCLCASRKTTSLKVTLWVGPTKLMW